MNHAFYLQGPVERAGQLELSSKIGGQLPGGKMSENTVEALRVEVGNLVLYVQRLRDEIAAMAGAQESGNSFDTVTVQLGAIVAGTENATNSILDAVEAIDDTTARIRAETDPSLVSTHCENLSRQSVRIEEACMFQDITGQRVTKIVRSLQFVEDRVKAMVELCGREEIDELVGKRSDERPATDEPQLEGPQLPGNAATQEEIDALFE